MPTNVALLVERGSASVCAEREVIPQRHAITHALNSRLILFIKKFHLHLESLYYHKLQNHKKDKMTKTKLQNHE